MRYVIRYFSVVSLNSPLRSLRLCIMRVIVIIIIFTACTCVLASMKLQIFYSAFDFRYSRVFAFIEYGDTTKDQQCDECIKYIQ